MPIADKKTQIQTFYRNSKSLYESAEDLTKKFLRLCGWEETCDTPGSWWAWTKKLDDGRTILTDTSNAIWIEEHTRDDLEEPTEG